MSRIILLIGVFCLIGFSACQFPGGFSAFYMQGSSYGIGYGTSFWFDATYPNFLRAKMVNMGEESGVAYHSALLGTMYYAWNVVQNVPVCTAKMNFTDAQMEIIQAVINQPKNSVFAGYLPLDGDLQTFNTAVYGPNRLISISYDFLDAEYPGFYMIRWDQFYADFHVNEWTPYSGSIPPYIMEVPQKCL